jgi:hypothetical protein
MATRKTAAKPATKKSTAKANQQAAKQRTTQKAKASESNVIGQTDLQKFGDADEQTQKAAAGAAQLEVTGFSTSDQRSAVSTRVGAVERACAERDRILQQAQREQEKAAHVDEQNVAAVMNDLQAPPRAPATNATGPKAHGVNEVGIHPDVTSPTNLYAAETPALPGTGVADPRDLAPGQDMSPSPPVSSSNILPLPDKAGTPFSKL